MTWINAHTPPGSNAEVLVFVDDLGHTVAHYSPSEQKWFRDGKQMLVPDYWMPLPEAPKKPPVTTPKCLRCYDTGRIHYGGSFSGPQHVMICPSSGCTAFFQVAKTNNETKKDES